MNNDPKPSSKLRLWILPILLVAWFLLLTQWHRKSTNPKLRVDAIMQTVRSYGSGIQGHFNLEPAAVPQENGYNYANEIRNLFSHEKYSELDEIARANRGGSLVEGGNWKSFEYYSAIEHPLSYHQLNDADYQKLIEKVTRWKTSFPESAAARISLASLYLQYAWLGRGEGYSDSVSASQWDLFYERAGTAEQILKEASQLKERDPHWYYVMIGIAKAQGWSRTDTRELLDQALAFEPGYQHFYSAYSYYLLPEWYGNKGDIQALAEEAAAKYPEPRGSILYFQIMSTLGCHCRTIEEQLTTADWPKLKSGYANLSRMYGTSNYNANRLAAMAAVFCDKQAAHAAFKDIAYRDTYVWTDEISFTSSRDWANGPDNQ